MKGHGMVGMPLPTDISARGRLGSAALIGHQHEFVDARIPVIGHGIMGVGIAKILRKDHDIGRREHMLPKYEEHVPQQGSPDFLPHTIAEGTTGVRVPELSTERTGQWAY